MGLLRVAVLGPPDVAHDGCRLTFSLHKAQALLIYLAVEGGMHPRSKLAALLWPDSEPPIARKALRNALALLRKLLEDDGVSSDHSTHLLSAGELLGLNPQAPLDLDLDALRRACYQAQQLTVSLTAEQRAAYLTNIQQALAQVRGPFLDGVSLGEDAPFDDWVAQYQQEWQMRLPGLFDRLSSWQEETGEPEQAKLTVARWLTLDPLAEEAYRRLMRLELMMGNSTDAWRVYVTCSARLGEALQIKPSAETVELAARIRASAAGPQGGQRVRSTSPTLTRTRRSEELVAPLVGRHTPFSQLAESFQQARSGQPQTVLVAGEAGIGKTRLIREWATWAAAQGALVLSGQAFEMGGRLPYQPLVEALRPRLEAENAPDDLLDDVWLAELSRILPELRARYPDLPTPTQDDLSDKVRLFEAVARLLDALADAGPVALLLDDLHWVDGASLDLVRYLGRHWIEQRSRALLLVTVRSGQLELNPALAAYLTELGRDLPVRRLPLQTLSREEAIHLVRAFVGTVAQSASSGSERFERGPDQSSAAGTSLPSEMEMTFSELGDLLFAQTDGHPLYLLEMLRLLWERRWLVPRLGADGAVHVERTVDLEAIVAQERSDGALLPPSVRALVLARLVPLSQVARQLTQASAVLGAEANAQRLWQVAEVEMPEGLASLEEAVKSGILREEEAGVGRMASYHFAHDLIRDVVYTELGATRRQLLHQRAFAVLRADGARATELAYHAMASGQIQDAFGYSVQAGIEAVAVFAVADAIAYYEQARGLLQEHQQLQSALPPAEVERLYAHLGQARAFQNDRAKAQEAYEELLAYSQQQRQYTLASMTLNRLALLALQQSSDKPQVYALLERALQVAQTSQEQKPLAETEWNLAQITMFGWDDPKCAEPHAAHALALAREGLDQELEARSLFLLGWIHVRQGAYEEGARYVEEALDRYALLVSEPTASRELRLPSFAIGAPLTQTLTNKATEAGCWATLAIAQVNVGRAQDSICSGRRALALAKSIKNGWVVVSSTTCLTNGLLEVGAYEESLTRLQHTMAQARILPSMQILLSYLHTLGRAYHSLQQWEAAHETLEEAVAVAELLNLGYLRVPTLSQMCMHYAVIGDWEQAHRYAVKASAIRNHSDLALHPLDYYLHFETEAFLRDGDERQAREDVQRLGERLGSNRRYRIPYLRGLAVLAEWQGRSDRAIDRLHDAARVAADLGVPAERWQIQAALGTLYVAADDPAHARTAFGEAARVIQELAEGIKDETLRASFLTGSQIQRVLERAHSLDCMI